MSSMQRVFLAAVAAVLPLAEPPVRAADWDRFRGPDGSGIATSNVIPDEFGPESNIRWKAAVPEGTSSPIIVGNRVFLTGSDEESRSIRCLDAATGETLWTDSVASRHPEPATAPAGPATPTPTSNGTMVFAFFPDSGTYAWSIDGDRVWEKAAAPSATMHGLSGSLVCSGNRLVLVTDQLRDSRIICFDSESGDVVWEQDRISGLTGAYATPVIYQPEDGPTQVIATGPIEVVGYDLQTGHRIWWAEGLCNAPVSSPVLAGNLLYFCEPAGTSLPFSMVSPMDKDKDGLLEASETAGNESMSRLVTRIDTGWGNSDGDVSGDEWKAAFDTFVGHGGLTCIRLGGTGDITADCVQWNQPRAVPYIPTVLADNELVFAVTDGGVLTSYNAVSGELIHRGRVPRAANSYYASPIASENRLLVIDTDGKANVVSREGEWESVATIDLGEPVYATPAATDHGLLIRTPSTLYCFSRS